MIHLKQILTLLLLIYQGQTFACDCKSFDSLDSSRKASYKYSDIVFLGELVKSDTTTWTYSFTINELFKGNLSNDAIYGGLYTSCAIFPTDTGLWIVYANFIDGSQKIEISQCLASRSQLRPLCNDCYDPPAPPAPDQIIDEEYEEKIKEESNLIIEKARQDWTEEVEILRKMKE